MDRDTGLIRKETAVANLTSMFERRIRAMIMEDFQGWEGTMESGRFKIQLSMDMVEESKNGQF